MIAPYLFTALTPQKGWGVFTNRSIKNDTIVEVSPVVVMGADEKVHLDKTTLYNYIFDWEGGRCCMAMGLIPVYNHASPSNCEYFQDYDEGTIYIKTTRAIRKGEELTVNYNGDSDHKGKVWFKVNP